MEKKEAKELIGSIMTDSIGILGGDVYKIDSHQLKPLYDNWSCERSNNKTEEEIVFSITFAEEIQY